MFQTCFHVCHHGLVFSSVVRFCVLHRGKHSSRLSKSFPKFLIHSAFLLCSLLSFCFLVIWLLACHRAGRIFCCFGMSCFVYGFILCRYLFSFPSFASTFWFISTSCIICFTSVTFFFLSQHIPAFYLCY